MVNLHSCFGLYRTTCSSGSQQNAWGNWNFKIININWTHVYIYTVSFTHQLYYTSKKFSKMGMEGHKREDDQQIQASETSLKLAYNQGSIMWKKCPDRSIEIPVVVILSNLATKDFFYQCTLSVCVPWHPLKSSHYCQLSICQGSSVDQIVCTTIR